MRAKTSQAAVSAYERGLKSPSLKVLMRLLAAADAEVSLRQRIDWSEHRAGGLPPFWVPSRLWRVPIPTCFDTVRMPDLIRLTEQDHWDLRDRTDRKRLYEMLLREGTPEMILRWVDGGFLVDDWRELELPAPIREAWRPTIAAAFPIGTRDSLAPIAGYGVEPLARLRARLKAVRAEVPAPRWPRRAR